MGSTSSSTSGGLVVDVVVPCYNRPFEWFDTVIPSTKLLALGATSKNILIPVKFGCN